MAQRQVDDLLALFGEAFAKLQTGFKDLPEWGRGVAYPETMKDVLFGLAERLHDNYPYFHPLYAGQMLKPPHPVAWLAYGLAMWINPNNHALDGGRATSAMEKEAVAELASMIGWDSHLGHLCSGGTMANLEALWVGRQLHPRTKTVASEQAHFTHQRISAVLGIDFEPVPADRYGRMDVQALEALLQTDDIGTVVATLGTTATGAIDPLPELLDLRNRYGFRLHVDAAYGGYFRLVDELSENARSAYARLEEADSVVIDPHKHGLQPYGCGCVLFRDPSVGRFYKHDSPYTYFSSTELHLGEISLECSRPGAAAAALWATQKLLPLTKDGEFASGLRQSRRAARALYEKLISDGRFLVPFPPELDIVVWTPKANTVSEASDRARSIFVEAARLDLHLALADLPVTFFDLESAGMRPDRKTISCLRSALMKPEHLEWIDTLYERLDKATEAVMNVVED
jgi:tyrosine decarboxylase / aspartate 1-decarboxylase